MEPDPIRGDLTMAAASPPVRTFASGRYAVVRALPAGRQKRAYLVRDTELERECGARAAFAGEFKHAEMRLSDGLAIASRMERSRAEA